MSRTGPLGFAFWIAGAVTAPLGFLMLALPSTAEAAKAAAEPIPFTPHVPYAMMLAGGAAMMAGVLAIWRSQSRASGLAWRRGTSRTGSTLNMDGPGADAAALAGLIVAAAALLGAIFAFIMGGPCSGSVTTGSCLSTHPEFYRQDASGFFYSTFAERLTLPLGLGAGLVSWLALAMGTGHRRAALWGLILGSLPLVGFSALLGLSELRFLLSGGFD